MSRSAGSDKPVDTVKLIGFWQPSPRSKTVHSPMMGVLGGVNRP